MIESTLTGVDHGRGTAARQLETRRIDRGIHSTKKKEYLHEPLLLVQGSRVGEG